MLSQPCSQAVRSAVPEAVPLDAEAFAQEAAECGHGEADDGARMPVDRADVGLAAAVDRECARDRERLACRDVGVDLGVAHIVGELDDGILDPADTESRHAAAAVDAPA